VYFRLSQLEDASSLAADFQTMRRDLRSFLTETECKLNAVDVASADSVEAAQNQLQEAKVEGGCFDSVFYVLWTVLEY